MQTNRLRRRNFITPTVARIIGSAVLSLASTAAVFGGAADQPKPSPASSQFAVKFDAGAIVSLKRVGDSIDTDYVGGCRLGDIVIRYRASDGGDWQSVQTATLAREEGATFSTNATGTECAARYQVKNGESAALGIETRYAVQDRAVLWTMTLQNLTSQPLEIGDLALPLTIGGSGRGGGGARGGARGGTNVTAGV